jgi:hypothetical protein
VALDAQFVHHLFAGQLPTGFAFFDAALFLRKKRVACLALRHGGLVLMVRERHRPAAAAFQQHLIGTPVFFGMQTPHAPNSQNKNGQNSYAHQ